MQKSSGLCLMSLCVGSGAVGSAQVPAAMRMTFFLPTLFPSVLHSAFFLSIDKEIGEAGVGYGKLKRIGVTKLGGKEQEIFWYSLCRRRF